MAEVQAQVVVLQAQQAQMLVRLAQAEARLVNQRRRSRNRRIVAASAWEGHALSPLVKEQPPTAGAANVAAVGALPPPNVFPADWMAVLQLNHARLNALATFYDEDFGRQGVDSLADRRDLFMAFIKG